MGTHMKTTIEIADPLLAEAKRAAAEDHTTLRELFESALRQKLALRKHREPFKLRDMSVDGCGPTPEWERATWEEKRAIIYGERG
jgi:Arc/MetJ family transcription regulator